MKELSSLTSEQAKGVYLYNLRLKIKERTLKAPWDFINEFVYIRLPNIGTDVGATIPFKLWPGQVEALKEIHENRHTIFLKARQMGYTWLALAYAVSMCIFLPGYEVVLISKKEDDSKVLIDRAEFILNRLPNLFVTDKKMKSTFLPWYESLTQVIAIYHPTGEVSTIKALSASPDSARSLTGSLIILDEWAFHPYAELIWTAAFPLVNRPDGGKVVGISTGERGTFFEQMWKDARAGKNTFKPIFYNWRIDPTRTDEWYETTKRNMPTKYKQEYPETEDDAFSLGEGAFYPEFDSSVHVMKDSKDWQPPAEGYRIYRAYDGGAQSACIWIAVDFSGNAICFKEYYPHRVIDSIQAEVIQDMSKNMQISGTIADPALWAKSNQTGESTQEVFSKAGIHMIRANNDRINGWKILREWLYWHEKREPRLKFTESCPNMIRTLKALPTDKNKPDDCDTKSEDHLPDALRYFVMSRPRGPLTEKAKKSRGKKRQRLITPTVSRITGY